MLSVLLLDSTANRLHEEIGHLTVLYMYIHRALVSDPAMTTSRT